MSVRPLILIIALAAASLAFAQPALAQNDAAARAQEAQRAQDIAAQRAIQDSLRTIDQVQQQQSQAALQAQIDNLQAQNRTEQNLRTLSIQGAGGPPAVPPLPPAPPTAVLAYTSVNEPANVSPFAPQQPAWGDASPAERQKAADTYAACMLGAARGLDDHTSDAATVAIAVEPACVDQFEAWKRVLERGAGGDVLVLTERSLDLSQRSTAVQAVLRERRPAPPVSN